MPTFYVENSPKNAKYRRMAVVYAKNKIEAEKKLLEKFPDATGLMYKEARLVNPDISSTIIK